MGLTNIKKELKKLDKAKLVDLIADLYKKNKSVKEFFDFYVNPDESVLFDKYRDKVFDCLPSLSFLKSFILAYVVQHHI
jgi:hypothetical protein